MPQGPRLSPAGRWERFRGLSGERLLEEKTSSLPCPFRPRRQTYRYRDAQTPPPTRRQTCRLLKVTDTQTPSPKKQTRECLPRKSAPDSPRCENETVSSTGITHRPSSHTPGHINRSLAKEQTTEPLFPIHTNTKKPPPRGKTALTNGRHTEEEAPYFLPREDTYPGWGGDNMWPLSPPSYSLIYLLTFPAPNPRPSLQGEGGSR